MCLRLGLLSGFVLCFPGIDWYWLYFGVLTVDFGNLHFWGIVIAFTWCRIYLGLCFVLFLLFCGYACGVLCIRL